MHPWSSADLGYVSWSFLWPDTSRAAAADMPAFQSCVEKGRVSGLMCSLNEVNGVPACANDWMLNQVARQDWGFSGCERHHPATLCPSLC